MQLAKENWFQHEHEQCLIFSKSSIKVHQFYQLMNNVKQGMLPTKYESKPAKLKLTSLQLTFFERKIRNLRTRSLTDLPDSSLSNENFNDFSRAQMKVRQAGGYVLIFI